LFTVRSVIITDWCRQCSQLSGTYNVHNLSLSLLSGADNVHGIT